MNTKIMKTKYIVITAILVIGIIGITLVVVTTINKKNNAYPTTTTSDQMNPSVRAEEEGISQRAAQIKNYQEYPEMFPSAKFDGRTFYIVAFRKSSGFKVPNFESGRNKDRGGVMIYERDMVVWENTDDFADIILYETLFRDVTGDGIPELLVGDSGGGNVYYCITTIYKWDGKTFNLITPEPYEGINTCSGLGEDEGLKDIDGDGSLEIISYTTERTHPDINDVDNPLYREETTVKQIYKFNGSKYILWKSL